MLSELESFYNSKEEPQKSCLLALRDIILNYHPSIQHVYKYKLPCFIIKKKIFCYIWIDKKTQFPYIAVANGVQIDHPALHQGNRTWVKLLYINPNEDIPIKTIHEIFDVAYTLI